MTQANCPEIDFSKTIYHVWKVADEGNAMFRVRKNFRTRQAVTNGSTATGSRKSSSMGGK